MSGARHVKARRDVALVPCAALSGVSAAAAVSAALRGDGDPLVLFGALALSLIGVLLVGFVDSAVARRVRSSSASYLIGSGTLVAMLVVIALRDVGTGTVYFAAIVPVACYLGLVLDRRLSAASLAVLEVVVVAVHFGYPTASWFDTVSIASMTLAGWFVGVLGQRAHAAADRHAELLSRADLLTWTLNRRGLFEVLPAAIAECDARARPCSLLVLDLDGFKQVNDTRGHSAGDEVLRRVGEVLAETLESGAAAARIGGDEFAVVLPGLEQRQAEHVGARIAARLAETIGLSIGVATREHGDLDDNADALLRRADAQLYVAKHRLGHAGAQTPPLLAGENVRREGGTIRMRPEAAPVAPVSYDRLRGRPRRGLTLIGVRNVKLVRSGYWVLAAVGALLVTVYTVETDDPSTAETAVAIGGAAWVLTLAGLGWWRSREAHEGRRREPTASWPLPFVETAALLAVGVGTLLLATDGIASAAVAALYLKVLFDAYVLGAKVARPAHAIVIGGWATVAALGPPDVLWAAPFQLALFVGSAAVGAVAHAAFDESAASSMRLAHTDSLTGLSNRVGLEDDLTRGLRSAVREGYRVGILLLDLDGFKQVNDTLGHAEGDRLLCDVADALRETLPDALATGRIGGDEFVAATRLAIGETAGAVADRLASRLAERTPASVGYAELPADGYDLAVLLGAADRRSYEVKQATRRAASNEFRHADTA